mmetsp:Transcript_40160/g.80525  ORF Transcript_40160/g.80525 Transcript_40160/m.80525 type:complete len:98 (+) Transcript_40160:118-411(+)
MQSDSGRRVPAVDARGGRAQAMPVQWKFLTPLIWAPAFPFIRMSLGRLSKRAQPWGIGAAIMLANVHAFWLINNPDLSDLEFASGTGATPGLIQSEK